MKKLLVMLLAAAVLLCGAAMAEEPFSFRDGLKWGMSPDEVQAAEGEFVDEYSFGGTDMALIEEGNYEGIDCMLQYMFIDNKFCAFAVGPRYDADSLTQQELEQIAAYLTAAYGEPAPAGAVPYLIDKFITNSGVEIVTGWQPTEDVYIALIDTYETTALYYFDPSVDFWAAENGEEPEAAPVETETVADEATEPAPAFTFRGLTWGMTPEEVEAVEGQEFDDLYSMTHVLTNGNLYNLRVSKFDAVLSYTFAEGKLAGVDITPYTPQDSTYTEDAEYLAQALTQLYGDPLMGKESLPQTLRELNQYGIDHTYFHVWLPTDDTCIYMYCYGPSEVVTICYRDVSLDWHSFFVLPIDTTGL